MRRDFCFLESNFDVLLGSQREVLKTMMSAGAGHHKKKEWDCFAENESRRGWGGLCCVQEATFERMRVERKTGEEAQAGH